MATINWSREAATILDDSALFEDVKDITDAKGLFLVQTTCYYKMKNETFYRVATNLKNGTIKDVYYEEDDEKINVKDVRKIKFSGLNKNLKDLGIGDIVEQLKKINNNPKAIVNAGDVIKVGNIEIDAKEAVAPSKPVFGDEKKNSKPKPVEPKKEDPPTSSEEKEVEAEKKPVVEISKTILTRLAENSLGSGYKGEPEVPADTSGVTIGFGYDASQQTLENIREDLSEAGLTEVQIGIIEGAHGLKGGSARAYLNKKEEGETLTNAQLFGTITEDTAFVLLNNKLKPYTDSMIDRMTRRASYHYDVEILLTRKQWNDLDETIKVLLLDLNYHGMLAGAAVYLENDEGKKETMVSHLLEAIAPLNEKNVRIVRVDVLEIFQAFDNIFDHDNIGYQIMKNAKPSIYYLKVDGKDEQGNKITKLVPKDNANQETFDFSVEKVRSQKSWKLDRRTALRKCYIKLVIDKLNAGYEVKIIED